MLQNQFSKPALGLEQFVRFFAQRSIQMRGATVVHPVPARAGSMIVFEFDDLTDCLYCRPQTCSKSHGVVIVGPQTYRRVEMRLRGNIETLVIMFQPDGLRRLFSIPMYELTDLDYDAHSVLGSFISHLRERLGNERDFTERVRLLEDELLQRALVCSSFDGISATANQVIFTGGRVGIPALAERAGLSMRQFERRFIQQVGMRPKLFARIARFEAALETKARFSTKSWTDVAHEFGYYDQMHMVHDFAEFTGKTPSETLSELENVFVDQIKTMRGGPMASRKEATSRLIL